MKYWMTARWSIRLIVLVSYIAAGVSFAFEHYLTGALQLILGWASWRLIVASGLLMDCVAHMEKLRALLASQGEIIAAQQVLLNQCGAAIEETTTVLATAKGG
jgi:hypothetical protein